MQQRGSREHGVALLTVVIVVVAMVGATASVVTVLTTRSRDVTQKQADTTAFYLAEAGLEEAKFEIAEQIDTGGDGIGFATQVTEAGTFSVQAEALGGDAWRLVSTGTSDDETTTVETIVGQITTTAFPTAAVSVAGELDMTNFKFKKNSDLLIDGGDRPAFVTSSTDLYDTLGGEFADAIASGSITSSSIVGTGTNTFSPTTKQGTGAQVSFPSDLESFLVSDLGKTDSDALVNSIYAGEASTDVLRDYLPSHLIASYEAWADEMAVASGEIELPIEYNAHTSSRLDDLSTMYTNLVAEFTQEIADADIVLDQIKETGNSDSSSGDSTTTTSLSDQLEQAELDLAATQSELDALDLEAADLQSTLEALIAEDGPPGQISKYEGELTELLGIEYPEVAGELTELEALVTDLEGQLAAAEEDDSDFLEESGALTYGTETEPVTVYLSQKMILKGGDISGHGTLIVDDEIRLESGSSINWTGDIIVMGTEKKHPSIWLKGGDMNVDGNLVVLGAGGNGDHTRFDVDSGGSVNVTGSFMMTTDYDDTTSNKAELNVMDGSINVDGLFTLAGAHMKAQLQKDSDVVINGMLQLGSPPSDKKEKLKLDLDGKLHITYDEGNLVSAVDTLNELDDDFDIDLMSQTTLTKDIVTFSWSMYKGTGSTSGESGEQTPPGT